jgi:hypothetical protein
MAQQRQSPNSPQRKSLTAERLRELLRYDPETGEWRWLKRSHGGGNARPGSKAGSRVSRNYLSIYVDNHPYRAARLAFFYMTGRWPTFGVDHIDGDPSNDRWHNLRDVSQSQNNMNKKRARNNTSGFKGVSWRKDCRKWHAQIRANGHIIHLGSFDTPETAFAEYCRKARELFGEYARFK